jgi:hypothetical protein
LLYLLVTQTFLFCEGTRAKIDEASAFVQQARSLPAEYRADIILRIAASALVQDAKRKQALTEEAFWQAAGAYLPYLQNADRRADSVDTNSVKPNGLEALTLQTRAIRQMLTINREKAFRLFSELPAINIPKLDCSTVFTPDVNAYYETAALLDAAFTPKERSRGDEEEFLEDILSSVDSAAQVPPAMRLIVQVRVQAEQKHDLLALLASRIVQLNRPDREYGGSEQALANSMEDWVPSPMEATSFLPSMRSYIVRHLSASRCTDNLPHSGELPISATAFNRWVIKLDPNHINYRPITREEVKPAGDEGTYQQHLFGTSSQALEIKESLQWLTHGNRVRDGRLLAWTPAERNTQEWLTHYDDADKLIHTLNEDDETSPEAFFCMKADNLNLLAALAPPSVRRENAMEEYIDFLENYYPSIQNRNLWFTMFRYMLYTGRFSSDSDDRRWILQRLSSSKNSVIALYASLELRIGPPDQNIKKSSSH